MNATSSSSVHDVNVALSSDLRDGLVEVLVLNNTSLSTRSHV